MDVFRGFNEASNTWSSMSSTTDYRERISYDANGNILKYLRNGISSISSNMDSLTYFYYSGTNRLKYVRDNVADNVYTNSSHGVEDINNQTNTSNYTYSEIGNLEKDLKDSIRLIKWNVYGKIVEIQRTASSTRPITNIKYTYDAAGNRISKRVVNNQNNIAEYTWYVRDAQGNVMATYFGSGQASTTLFSSNYNLTVTDQHIYGSSRVGVFNRNFDVKTAYVRPAIITFERGLKMHELSNHLGNVLVTVSDKKIAHYNANGVIDYYTADVVTANDYYPGGMLMPGRKYSSTSSYRYGFNGKENDNEVKGEGNQQDYGMRIYDPRLVRFLSTDPLTAKYPELTPYQFASNRPIDGVDLDGTEWASQSEYIFDFMTGQPYIKTTNYVKIKVINESKIVTNPDIIKAKAELVARSIEKTMSTTIQVPLKLPDEVFVTKVILDFTAPTPDDLPTIGRLTFDDRTSVTTTNIITSNGLTTTTTATSSVPGETKGAIANFTIKIGITMDGNMVNDKDLENTSGHEGAHSAGINHPWELSDNEKQLTPNLNQNDPILRNKSDIHNNMMNSAENPNPSFRRNSGNTILPGQIKAASEKIQKESGYEIKDL
jgi:RHS repeat-associated protein